MSKSSELDKKVKSYILENIDATGYDIPEPTTDKEKVQFLHDTFMSEYGWHVEQDGPLKAMTDYLQGLPSSLTVAFYNSEIIEIAHKWGSLSDNATEKQEDKIISNWFNLLANKTLQLFRKHGINC